MMSRVFKTNLTLSLPEGGTDATIEVRIVYLFFPEQRPTLEEPGHGPTAQVVTIEGNAIGGAPFPSIFLEALFDADEELEAVLIADAILSNDEAKEAANENRRELREEDRRGL